MSDVLLVVLAFLAGVLCGWFFRIFDSENDSELSLEARLAETEVNSISPRVLQNDQYPPRHWRGFRG